MLLVNYMNNVEDKHGSAIDCEVMYLVHLLPQTILKQFLSRKFERWFVAQSRRNG